MKYVSAAMVLISLVYLGRFAAESFTTRGQIYDDVGAGWTVQIDGEKPESASLPIIFDRFTKKAPGAKATLSTSLALPAKCRDIQCYLFFGEVGDLSKVFINGRLARSLGYAEGFKSVAKHIPLWAEIPNDASSELQVRLEIESLYGIGFGIPRGPVFIGDYAAVRSTERLISLQSVDFPLMQALVLSILGLLALACLYLAKFDQSLFKFSVFALTEAAFMLSFSFVPREYLPVTEASAIHFCLRLMADWALFECLNALLPITRFIRWPMRVGFVGFLFWLGFLYSQSASYPDFVHIVQLAWVVIFGSPLIALSVAVLYQIRNRTLPTPRQMDLGILIPTLAVLTVLQGWDTSVFWGFFPGTYTVKFYLAPLALIFAIVYVKRHVRHYEALKRSNVEAEKDAILGRIAMEFSHDLKSPLGSLRDWSLQALEQNDTDFMKLVLNDVVAKTTRVSQRIQELFNYAKDELGEKTRISLLSFCCDLEAELRPRLEQKKIRFSIDVLDRMVLVDVQNLKRALLNLLDNAISAAPVGGIVSLRGATSRQRFMLCVEDNGVGIDDNDISLIFEPYFTKGKKEGTGLGLAIVDRIVRQHGGEVQVFSKRDCGSTFVVEIPQ